MLSCGFNSAEAVPQYSRAHVLTAARPYQGVRLGEHALQPTRGGFADVVLWLDVIRHQTVDTGSGVLMMPSPYHTRQGLSCIWREITTAN